MVDTASKTGFISQIIGPVVDIEFPNGELPKVYNALSIASGDAIITAEVQQLLGNNKVRAVSMTATDGLKRGASVTDTGAPITVPVGVKTLGRIFNVLGEPVDEMGPCEAPSGLPIHRSSPSFTDLETKPAIFETGIKVVDILAPYRRGGTCDISAWDAFYLATFWMLNTIAWVTFYWHWKHMTLWQGNAAQFNESSNYLMGWFRDYLWLNSSPLINGYNPFGMNNLSVWAWMFLFAHLMWATGFMFLISWRGYWQELIETLVWAHERTPIANLLQWRDKPVALSIVQARLVGLTHFAAGFILTYAAFVIASTAGKFG